MHRHGVRYQSEGCPICLGTVSELIGTHKGGATQDKLPEEWLLRFEPIVTGIIMAREPLSMRQIKELLRLKHEHGLSVRQIARSCGLPVSTVGDYLKRAQEAGLNWPLPEQLTEGSFMFHDDEELLACLRKIASQAKTPASSSPQAGLEAALHA